MRYPEAIDRRADPLIWLRSWEGGISDNSGMNMECEILHNSLHNREAFMGIGGDEKSEPHSNAWVWIRVFVKRSVCRFQGAIVCYNLIVMNPHTDDFLFGELLGKASPIVVALYFRKLLPSVGGVFRDAVS